MATVDPNDFGPYESYLNTNLWPSRSSGAVLQVDRDEMSPNQAASSLAKLVRWARMAPMGDIAVLTGEDEREEVVRKTRLGTALAARACNLEEEHFHALYGEFGDRADADPHEVLAEVAVALGDHGLEDWPLNERIKLGAKLTAELMRRFEVKEPIRRPR